MIHDITPRTNRSLRKEAVDPDLSCMNARIAGKNLLSKENEGKWLEGEPAYLTFTINVMVIWLVKPTMSVADQSDGAEITCGHGVNTVANVTELGRSRTELGKKRDPARGGLNPARSWIEGRR
jgi:hypothetical protein